MSCFSSSSSIWSPSKHHGYKRVLCLKIQSSERNVSFNDIFTCICIYVHEEPLFDLTWNLCESVWDYINSSTWAGVLLTATVRLCVSLRRAEDDRSRGGLVVSFPPNVQPHQHIKGTGDIACKNLQWQSIQAHSKFHLGAFYISGREAEHTEMPLDFTSRL